MAGPIVQLRPRNYGKNEQNKVDVLFKRIAIIHEKTENSMEFSFKKGKTLGLNLKSNSCVFCIMFCIQQILKIMKITI